jgi:hypothetical protein
MWKPEHHPFQTTRVLAAVQERIFGKKKHNGRALFPSSSFSKYAYSRHESLARREELT